MSCVSLNITPLEPSVLSVSATPASSLAVAPTLSSAVAAKPSEQSAITATPVQTSTVIATPAPQMQVIISEVCSIGGGTLVVLAAKDGPLRLKNGGYILLNPATNPPES